MIRGVSRIDLFASYDYNVNTARFDDICLAVENCTAYEYDDKGNVTAVNHTEQSGTDAEYNDAGNPIEIVDEATGTYTYTYDSAQNLLTSTWDGITTEYQYNTGKLNTYTKVTVGGKTLKESTYRDITGEMLTSLLPFGDTLYYDYDLLGRLTEISNSDGDALVEYTYDGFGNISCVKDNVSVLTTELEYDSIGRLLREIAYSTNSNIHSSIGYSYDGYGRVDTVSLTLGALNSTESYDYDATGLVSGKTNGNGDTVSIVYDAFNRLQSRAVTSSGGTITQSYEYYSAHTDTCETLLPKKVVYNNGTSDWISAGATYDGAYNVTELQRNGETEGTFAYDSAYRLSTESYSDGYTNYSYDERGNIRRKRVYENGTLHMYVYEYGGTQADALKSYDGVDFTYNAYGYPTAYYNGSNYTFSWDTYGNLSGATKGSKTLSYSYDISGLRTSKAISGGLTQTYYYDGDKLIGQVCSDGTAIMFNYGTDGEMFGFSRMVNGYQYDYYYVKNAQGDVLKVMNQNMDVVARYYYDAWGAIRQVQDGDGNIISDTTSQNCIANINPIRYRGYYYDIETGLYYLQTRYYDPEIGRFISRDSYEYIGANGDLGSYNLFAYCSNNLLKYEDPSGCGAIGDFFTEIGRRISENSHVFAGLGATALADGPSLLGDLLAFSVASVFVGGYAIDGLVKSVSKLYSNSRTDAKTQEIGLTKAILHLQ